MNRYALICRLTGPAMLILTGVLALLNQANILSWGKSWPLYLILWGVLKLAQRAALASCEAEAYPGYPGAYPGAYPEPYPGAYGQPPVPPATPSTTTSIVPASGSASDPDEWRP